ncbi:hypothetical protein FIBSPDRAFT_875710 [Athelia psychrophila]|uniref:Uncharacterized protein n=1 Tax=Athelia psychrophila TaxID=1759441 RepID=A0A167XK44_9AGAM|nr:hypothetical protein FIBSPDRAFT_875710 [Fibularhizoctonia sp. CBS 109695]
MDEHPASAQCSVLKPQSALIVADTLRRYRRAIPPAPKPGLRTRAITSLGGRWMEGMFTGCCNVRPYDLRMERVDQCCNHTYVYCMYIIANTLTYAVTFLS